MIWSKNRGEYATGHLGRVEMTRSGGILYNFRITFQDLLSYISLCVFYPPKKDDANQAPLTVPNPKTPTLR